MVINDVIIEDLPVGDKHRFTVKCFQAGVQHGSGFNFPQ